MIFNYPTPEIIAAWGVVVSAISAIAFKIWRSSYKTSLDNRKDTIEGTALQLVLDRLQKQNDDLKLERDLHKEDAQLAWKLRMEDAKKIAALESENIYLKSRLEQIAKEVDELKHVLQEKGIK